MSFHLQRRQTGANFTFQNRTREDGRVIDLPREIDETINALVTRYETAGNGERIPIVEERYYECRAEAISSQSIDVLIRDKQSKFKGLHNDCTWRCAVSKQFMTWDELKRSMTLCNLEDRSITFEEEIMYDEFNRSRAFNAVKVFLQRLSQGHRVMSYHRRHDDSIFYLKVQTTEEGVQVTEAPP